MSILNDNSHLIAQDDRTKDDDLRALARMIEYASMEAKKNGLLLTGHLLELAGWSLRVATPDAAAERPMPYEARTEKPN
jgi:hypothetical protein